MSQWYLRSNRLFLLLGITTLTNAWTTTTTTIHHTRQRMATHLHGQSKQLEDHHNNNLLIVGFGRVGQQVAQLASKPQRTCDESIVSFQEIVGTVRNAENVTTAMKNHENDNHNESSTSISCIPISQLPQELARGCYTHVLIAMPPNQEIYNTILQNLQQISWLGMVSTTGVYGNHNGGWVTEDSALKCTSSSTASQYIQWEDTFGQAKCPFRIFRCAGIYDSTRSALHTLWKQQANDQPTTTNSNKDEFKTNRIHVTDIAQAIVNSMIMMMDTNSNDNFEIYNLADDMPERRSVVMEYAATLLTKRLGNDWKSKRGESQESVVKAKKRSNGSSNNTTTRETKSVRRRRRELEPKMIDNQKLKMTLLPQLKYPTYKEGLDAILLDPKAPWNRI